MYFQYIPIFLSRHFKYRYFFDITLLDLPYPYVDVSIDPVTHMQGLLAYALLEKTIATLIRHKLGT